MRKTIIAFIIIGTALAGCAKKGPQELPPPPSDAVAPGGTPSETSSGATAPVPGSQGDFLASITSDRIFFDLDQYQVDDEDKATLQSQAQWLQRYAQKQIVIEGHADERGTRDYNLALGERRANAAKNYLASLGIASTRINVISYGKEKPAALGSDEGSWAQNRRAVTVTVD